MYQFENAILNLSYLELSMILGGHPPDNFLFHSKSSESIS